MTNQELAARLRGLADVYEANPNAAQLYELAETKGALVFCHTPQVAAATIKAFGPGVKEDADGCIRFKPTNFPEIKVMIFKENVCERVKVGKREIPERVMPAVPETVVPARTEEVFEWRCGSLLNLAPLVIERLLGSQDEPEVAA